MPYSTNILLIALLGICAANVAHLVFARAITRESEITVRTAMGASRGRIIGQFVAEALVLASIAAVVGLAGANFIQTRFVEMLVGGSVPFWWNEHLSIDTIAYSALLVIIAALVTGGLPALRATGPHMNARLKEAAAGGSTLRFGKVWTGVVVAQVALTSILLLVVVCSSWTVYLQSNGSAEVTFPRNEYLVGQIFFEGGATTERQSAVRRELQRRFNNEPSVINATFASRLPDTLDMDEFWIELPAAGEGSGKPLAIYNPMFAGLNYFETFQQPLVAGRLFTASEIEEKR